MRQWQQLAVRADIVRRSFKVAVIVGTILVTINYWDKLYPFKISMGDWVKMALTYCVPYCVSTYAAISAVSEKTES